MDIDTLLAMIPGSFPFSPSSPSSTTSYETTDTVENATASNTTDVEHSVDDVSTNDRHITISRSCLLRLRDALNQAGDMLNGTNELMTIPAKAMPEFTFPRPAENANLDAQCVEQIFEDVVLVLQAFITRADSSKAEPAEILEPKQEESDEELQQSVMVKVEDIVTTNDEKDDYDIEGAIKEAMSELCLDL